MGKRVFYHRVLRLNLPALPRAEIIRVMSRDYRVARDIALLPSRGTNTKTLVRFLRNLSKSKWPYFYWKNVLRDFNPRCGELGEPSSTRGTKGRPDEKKML